VKCQRLQSNNLKQSDFCKNKFKSASFSSKADTLNILRKNYRMRQLLLATLFPVVKFLKCVVTEVALFSIFGPPWSVYLLSDTALKGPTFSGCSGLTALNSFEI